VLNWQILLTESSPGTYEMRVRYPGAPRGGHRFVRQLPPDFSDFLAPPATGAPTRIWRRPPGDKVDEALLFCAGDLDTLKDIGTRLHEALFKKPPEAAGDLTGEFLALREAAAMRNEGMDVRIDLTDAPQLARVPWESLYLAADDLFLGIDAKSNIVRILAPDRPGPLPAAVKPPLRMLVAVANPRGELETGAELADIKRRLDGLLEENCTRYELRTLPEATRSQFGSQIEDWKPHIVHFIGHGGFDDERGLIYFHDEHDPAKRDPVDSATLRDLVRNDRPWLVVLNSCLGGAAAKADPFGGAAQNLIRINVPFVVAMQSPISDEAAVRFSQRFYASLLRGDPVAAAVTRGRNAIRSLGQESLRAELITPVLYSTGEAQAIAMAEPPSTLTETPPPPPPATGFWASRVVPALPTAGNVAGIVSAVIAVVGIYYVVQSAGAEKPPMRAERAMPGGTEHALARSEPIVLPIERGHRQPAQYRRPPPRFRPAVPAPTESRNYGAGSGYLAFGVASSADAGPSRPGVIWDSDDVRGPVEAPSSPSSDLHETARDVPGLNLGSSSYASVATAAAAIAIAAIAAADTNESEARAAAESRRQEQVATLVRRAFGRSALEAMFGGVPAARPTVRLYRQEAARRAISPELPEYRSYSGVGGPREDSGSSRDALTFARGSLALSKDSARNLEYAALDARNGARIGVLAVVGGEPDAPGLARSRLASVLDYLLLRGAPPSLLEVEQARADAGALAVMASKGVGGLIEIETESSRSVQRRGVRVPVPVIASFAPGSSEPLAETHFGFDSLLRTEPGSDLMVHLVGRVDSEEEAASGTKLADARVRYVAERMLLFGAPEGSILRGAAPARADAANPYLERRVDASLAFRSAARVDVPLAPRALPAATAAALDRLAGWLTRYRYFAVHLGAADAAPDPDLAARTERLRSALRERGIADDRITAEPAAPAGEPAAASTVEATGPAAASPPDPVEIVIVPLE
jgi:hypothetical protein